MNYWHIATEIFYQQTCCDYVTCNGSGEDPNCSDQFTNPLDWSVSDHLDYYGVYSGCTDKEDSTDGESPTQ